MAVLSASCTHRPPLPCKNGGYDDGWHCICPAGTGDRFCETVHRKKMTGAWDFFQKDPANQDSLVAYKVVIMEDTPGQDRIIIDNLVNRHERLRAIAKKDSLFIPAQQFQGKTIQGRAGLYYDSKVVYTGMWLFCTLEDTISHSSTIMHISGKR